MGTNVDIAPCDGSDRQKWSLSSKGEIIHLPSGKCLDADGNNDNEVELYSCFDAAWQKWDLRGKTLKNRGLHKCLDIKNCPDGNCEGGTDIWVYDCYGGEIKIGSGIFDIVIPIMYLFILFVHANQISYL